MTVLVASSIVRGSPEGASHGAVHLVDVTRERVAHVLDWKARGVDWTVPGGGRGLRGIAFDGQRVFVAAADALFAFSPDFELLEIYRSPYLSKCQAIACFERRMYVVCKGFDAVLGFNLDENRFDRGLHIRQTSSGLQGSPFDPQTAVGPGPGGSLGLNSLWCDGRGMFLSGSSTLGLLLFDVRRLERVVTLPRGVMNARPWRDGVLFNDTEAGVSRFLTPTANRVFRAPHYPERVLTGGNTGIGVPEQQGFVRGLCVVDDSMFAAGSSPSTITLHNLDTMKTIKSIALSTDPRHSIHSLAIWPYAVPDQA